VIKRTPVTHKEVFSTGSAAANVSVPNYREIDVVDLMPCINFGISEDPHGAISWRKGTFWAVRSGDWKLQLGDPEVTTFLFNLMLDATEQNNLSVSEPRELDRLERWI